MNGSWIRPQYQTRKQPKPDRMNFADAAAVIFAAYMLGGSTSGGYLYLSACLMAVWLISAFLISPAMVRAMFLDPKCACFLIYFVLIGIAGVPVAGVLYTAKQMGAAVLLFAPILIFQYFRRLEQASKLDFVLKMMLLVWIFFCGKALIFYQSYQNAARTLASHRDAYGTISIGGGYSLAYGSAILSVLMLELLLTNQIQDRWGKCLAAAAALLGTLVVLQTESTVTIVCWAAGVLTCLLFRPEEKRKGAFRTAAHAALFAAIMLLLTMEWSQIGEWIAERTELATGIVGIRLHSLGAALAGESGDGAYAISRLTIPFKSLKTFLKNPIFGVADQHGNGFLNSSYYGIGNHCEWADALGNYGLVGGIPFFMMYFLQVKETAKFHVRVSPAWWLVLLLLGTFNPFQSFQSNFVVFFFTPAILWMLGERKGTAAQKREMETDPANENKENCRDASVYYSRGISQRQ